MKTIKILSLVLFFASMGFLSSCSKENETEDNELTKYIGRWETTDVLFDFSYESYLENGQPDVRISNWKTKTDVPHYVVLQEDGRFMTRIKNRTTYGDWEGDYYPSSSGGLYIGEIYLGFDNRLENGRMNFTLQVLSVTEQTMVVESDSFVEPGVFPECEEETHAITTITFKKM